MEETLTQKSRRRENSDLAIAMVKAAIITACHAHYWRGGAFYQIRTVASDVDIDLERLEESSKVTEAERAIFRDTRSKIADVRAYMEGRPANLANVDDISWVRTLKSVFAEPDEGAKEAADAEKAKGGHVAKPASSKKDHKDHKDPKDPNDGFERQKVYGGSSGPPKE